MKSLYMEHTTIDVTKTIQEIARVLMSIGALSITTTFKDLRVSGLTWTMMWDDRRVHFRMPARVEPVFGILRKRRGRISEREVQRLQEQAERVAWRQLLRWSEAQAALIQTGMVKATEPFVAYMTTPDGRLMFDSVEAHLALTAGGGE